MNVKANWTNIAIGGLLAAGLFLTSCSIFQPKYTSPTTGEKKSEIELRAEWEREQAAKQQEIERIAAEAQAKLATAQADLNYRINQESAMSALRISELQHEADQQQLTVNAEVQQQYKLITDGLANLNSSYQSVFDQIEADKQNYLQAIAWGQTIVNDPTVQAVGGAIPGGPLVLAALSLFLGRASKAKVIEGKDEALRAAIEEKQKIANDVWDEAIEFAMKMQGKNDSTWDEATKEAERNALLATLLNKVGVNVNQ